MNNEAANGSRPRRSRWFRKASIAIVAILLLFGVGVWWFSWWAPPTYVPDGDIMPHGVPLSSAGHDERTRLLGGKPYLLHITPDRSRDKQGSLLYFGALHSKDAEHPQLAELRRVWAEFKPTVALVEGRMSFFVGTATQGIGVFGEGAAVYALAEHAGIPLYTLEPPLEVEVAALDECGDRTQVAMFRFLSGYLSARRGGSVSSFKINRLLSQRAAPLTEAFPSIAAFDTYYAAQFPQQPTWRDLPEEAMWPGKTDTILHRMATRSNLERDKHFNRVLLDLVNRGERVLAIAGRSHVIIQEPVLWESLQPAARGELSSVPLWKEVKK